MRWRRSCQNLKRSSLMVIHSAIMQNYQQIHDYISLMDTLLFCVGSNQGGASQVQQRLKTQKTLLIIPWVREEQQLHHSSTLAAWLRWSEWSCTVTERKDGVWRCGTLTCRVHSTAASPQPSAPTNYLKRLQASSWTDDTSAAVTSHHK